MALINDSIKSLSKPSINGDSGNTILLNSLDDEESFVVLERSTANDVVVLERSTASNVDLDCNIGISTQYAQPFQTLPSNCSFPVFNNFTTSGLNRPSHQNQTIPVDSVSPPFDGTTISVSLNAEEIDKRLQEVLQENIRLKETLYQTNMAMKQQLSTMKLLQDRSVETQKNHQSKFDETKALILKLGSEKIELQEVNNIASGEVMKLKEELMQLKEANIAFGAEEFKLKEEVKQLKEANITIGAEQSKLLSENVSLKKQLNTAQETLKTITESGKKSSLQPTVKEIELHELVEQLTKKLEVVERARRQHEFEIERLNAHLGRAAQDLNETQQKLAHSEHALQITQAQGKNETSLHYGEKLIKYDGLLTQFKKTIQEEQSRATSLTSWLTLTEPRDCLNSGQFEISELRCLLANEQVQSVARKDNLYSAISMIQELLFDYQKLSEELERVKADHALKESHVVLYDEMQKKGFTERIDSLTAKLVETEEALAISERHLSSLNEAVRLQNVEKKDNAEIKILKEQVQTLTNEARTKEDLLRAKGAETDLLKEEIQNLQSVKETVPVLEEQAKIYQDDFEAERKARESLVAEKERLLEDLRCLHKRNQDLIDELHVIRNGHQTTNGPQELVNPNLSTRHQAEPMPHAPPKPQDDDIPMRNKYICPNPECNMIFTTVEPLQLHVITCLKLDD